MPDQQWLDGYAVIGTVARPWGVRGEVRVNPESDHPERYASLDSFFVGNPELGEVRPVGKVRLRAQGGFWRASFEGISTPEAAESLRSALLLVRESDRPALPEGEFYFSDLAGLAVVDDAGAVLGRVVEVRDYPSVNVFDLELDRDDAKKRVLAPWIADCVGKIDLAARTVVVHVDYLADLLSADGAEKKDPE